MIEAKYYYPEKRTSLTWVIRCSDGTCGVLGFDTKADAQAHINERLALNQDPLPISPTPLTTNSK